MPSTELQQRYDDLAELRETAPERESKRARAALSEVERASAQMVASLEKALKAKQAEAEEATELAEQMQRDNAGLRAKVEQLKRAPAAPEKAAAPSPPPPPPPPDSSRRLALYEVLTGLAIEEDGTKLRCVCRGKENEYAFTLGDEGETYDFTPSANCAPALKGYFEKQGQNYLLDEEGVEFEKIEAPTLVAKIFGAVHR